MKSPRRSRGRTGRSRRDPGGGRAVPPTGASDPVLVNLVSLGCPKNLIDSELILGRAGEAGVAITSRAEDADVIVVNTCGFIDAARQESIQAIREACESKRASRGRKRVLVVGCLAQRSGEEIRRLLPQVDAIVGLGQYDGIGNLILELSGKNGTRQLPGGGRDLIAEPNRACSAEVGRFRLTPRHYAYLRISEGCDNPCTFCAIPGIRGPFRSKPLPEIEAEARELVRSGARELILISQDTTSYGIDLGGKFLLPDLLERVASVDGVRWVRVLYVYPTFFSDDMIEAMARIPKVLKYIDIPIQHIADRILRRMGRRMDETDTRRLLSRLRERIPGLYLRTTFIVGFPGEGEDEFRSLLDFVRDFRFERMGVFTYSREEGTPAARMDGTLPEEVVLRRREELMLVQQEVAFAQNRSRIGETCEAVIDGEEGGASIARSHGEAPEIDPLILIPRIQASPQERRGLQETSPAARGFRELTVLPRRTAQGRPEVGEFLNIQITGTRGYDLIAHPVPSEDI